MIRTAAWGAALLVPLLLLTGCGRDQPASALVGTEEVAEADRGEPIAFTGTTMDAEGFDLADYRGRIVVINAWASWCEPCRAEMPAFVDLDATADPDEVAVIGLNVSDEPAAAEEFVDELGMPFPSVVDREGAILATLPGIPPKSLPSTVILDRDGRIAARIIGPTDPIGLARELGRVMGEDAAQAGA